MRLCRYRYQNQTVIGFYADQSVVGVHDAARAYTQATGTPLTFPGTDDLLYFLPPDAACSADAEQLGRWIEEDPARADALAVPVAEVQLQLPVARPNKLLLLAGNYAKHIEEGGEFAVERAKTYPYVFMKPPSTTLTPPGGTVRIPRVSPQTMDWECELAVVIGRGGRSIKQDDALGHVAGYTVLNDISDREFTPNPSRQPRERDGFFDWLHGKWHDTSCPMGPCIASPTDIPDPQNLKLQLSVNDKLFQDATTAQQIFPVAAVIEFISSFVTLEAGDVISTGTPAGVGRTTGTYLQPGDQIRATIEGIGTLVSEIGSEPA